jgi:opacity protein-like surface antigen
MHTRSLALLLALAATPPALAAQATGDQARLVFTVFGGYIGGQDLWTVGAQPLVDDVQQLTDVLALSRRFEASWTAGLSATYYKGSNVGITGELQVIDARMRTSCDLLTSSGSIPNRDVCASLDGALRSTLATAFTLGAIFRVLSRADISPYFRAQGGLYVIGASTTAVTGSYFGDDLQPRFIDIYPEDGNSHVSAQFALGAGVTIPLAKAYQLRLEGRGISYGVPVVTGPTERQFIVPPTETRWNTQFQVLVGIDLVLERKRGRRY